MVENTQQVDATTIEVVRPVAPGENVVQPGEDLSVPAKPFCPKATGCGPRTWAG